MVLFARGVSTTWLDTETVGAAIGRGRGFTGVSVREWERCSLDIVFSLLLTLADRGSSSLSRGRCGEEAGTMSARAGRNGEPRLGVGFGHCGGCGRAARFLGWVGDDVREKSSPRSRESMLSPSSRTAPEICHVLFAWGVFSTHGKRVRPAESASAVRLAMGAGFNAWCVRDRLKPRPWCGSSASAFLNLMFAGVALTCTLLLTGLGNGFLGSIASTDHLVSTTLTHELMRGDRRPSK